MRIDPKTHTLASLRRRSLSHARALAELIDNSLDANAQRVRIETSHSKVVVTDDGRGVDRAGLCSMLTVGAHADGNDAGLGIYGVGFNLAALWLANEVAITGIRRGELATASVNWKEVEKSGEWEVSDPLVHEASPDERVALGITATGTRIAFSRLEHRSPSGKPHEDMCGQLRWMFTPALQQGRQIIINGRPLAPLPFPPCSDSIESDLTVAGRSVRVRCGVVQEGHPNDFRGFVVAFRHRWINKANHYCKDFPAARIAGEITLGPEWHADLSDNKNKLIKNGDELTDAVHDACRHLFEKGQSQARALHIEQLSRSAAAIVRTFGGGGDGTPNAKAKRASRQRESGTVIATGLGPRHRGARVSQAGRTFAERLRRGISIEFDHMGGDDIGEADTQAVRVILNLDHPYIAQLSQRDDAYGAAAMAVVLLGHEQISDRSQRVFNFATDSFGKLIGMALARPLENEATKPERKAS